MQGRATLATTWHAAAAAADSRGRLLGRQAPSHPAKRRQAPASATPSCSCVPSSWTTSFPWLRVTNYSRGTPQRTYDKKEEQRDSELAVARGRTATAC